MDKVYQVFVSSTFTDLEDERRQVSNALAKAGHLVAGMELFPATDQQQLDFIKRIIDRSDYYVVIVGGRYGSPAEDGISFTEHEFEYARSKGIPVLAFLHGQPGRIEVRKTDQDPDKAARLEAFRAKLRDKRMVVFWTDANDLCASVLIAISQATNLTPRVGWVRGDQAIDPRVLQETERVRIENADLRRRLEDLQGSEVTFDPSLVGPEGYLNFRVVITVTLQPNGRRETFGVEAVRIQIGELFVRIYDALLAEPKEYALGELLGRVLSSEVKNKPEKGGEYTVTSADEISTLRFQLEALNLIEVFGGTSQISYGPRHMTTRSWVAWRPTDKGRLFVVQSRKILRRNSQT